MFHEKHAAAIFAGLHLLKMRPNNRWTCCIANLEYFYIACCRDKKQSKTDAIGQAATA